jgi:1,2-diacylglycerol 3-beta-glucosyltransferase
MSNNSVPLPDNSDQSIAIMPNLIDFEAGIDGRRLKAALILVVVWSLVFCLHVVPGSGWIIWGIALIFSGQMLRLFVARTPVIEPVTKVDTDFPLISLVISAHNEENVVEQLAANLGGLDYPADRYEVWVIDDRSTDRTPQLLDELAQQYPQLQVLHRTTGSGGKSGALNQVWPLLTGEFIGVFDADAQVSPNFLQTLVPYFDNPKVGAVQMRKSIANATTNWLTQGQSIEMTMDAYIQQQRILTGGIGELRGNGQFLRRQALIDCGGWNEETITDDLDLTFRLHLQGWDIDLALWPCVQEEGVTTLTALWPQRQRWGEGGYQRYLDYWRLITANKLGTWQKNWDLGSFSLFQYILPLAMVPDLALAIAWQESPLLTPLTVVGIILQVVGMIIGAQRIGQQLSVGSILVGLLYLVHWVVVMPWTTVRMAFQPKTLKWVKTPRQADSTT